MAGKKSAGRKATVKKATVKKATVKKAAAKKAPKKKPTLGKAGPPARRMMGDAASVPERARPGIGGSLSTPNTGIAASGEAGIAPGSERNV